MKARHEAKRERFCDWTGEQTNRAQSLEAKEQNWANYRETAKTLAEKEAQALADWQAKLRVEKIHQLAEERICCEVER